MRICFIEKSMTKRVLEEAQSSPEQLVDGFLFCDCFSARQYEHAILTQGFRYKMNSHIICCEAGCFPQFRFNQFDCYQDSIVDIDHWRDEFCTF